MPRSSTVTVEEVRGAIEALKAQGVPDPGVHRIRALIGHGSVTTINKLKHQIRTEDLKRLLPGTTKPMPDPITEAAADLWIQLNAEIDLVEEVRKKEIDEELSELQLKYAGLLTEHEALQTAVAEKNRRLEQLATELSEVRGRESSAQETIHKLNTELLLIQEQNKALQFQIDAGKENLMAQAAQHKLKEQKLQDEINRLRTKAMESSFTSLRRGEVLEQDMQRLAAQLAALSEKIDKP